MNKCRPDLDGSPAAASCCVWVEQWDSERVADERKKVLRTSSLPEATGELDLGGA